MTDAEHELLVPLPASGRVYAAGRRVRLGDASPGGRLRLDACVRYLQDIANDDSRDAGSPNPTAWVARRTVLRVERFPEYLDMVTLRTWCGGLGPRWAERRYSVRVDGVDGAAGASGVQCMEAATLWVHIDMQTMKPINVPADFAAQFGEAAAGRKISARLHLPSSPDASEPSAAISTLSWPLRFVDFDVLGHVNNSVYWAIVEEQLARLRHLRAPFTVTLEHHDAIDPGDEVLVTVVDTTGGFDMWVRCADSALAAVVRVTGRPAR